MFKLLNVTQNVNWLPLDSSNRRVMKAIYPYVMKPVKNMEHRKRKSTILIYNILKIRNSYKYKEKYSHGYDHITKRLTS